MKEVTPYLNFDGNCHQAMTFYGESLGLKLEVMKFSETPCDASEAAKDRLAHARLIKGSVPLLMASDTPPNMPLHPGNNFSVSINCETKEEIEKFYAALSKGGKPVMPLQDMFWGAYWGMLVDQFGIQWMFNFEHPKKA